MTNKSNEKIRLTSLLNRDFRPELQSIEIWSGFQIPQFQIIGLPNQEIHESRERIRAAIEAARLKFPHKRVVVNLSPSSVRKQGTGIDLAIALAILAHEAPEINEAIENRPATVVVAWGELGLDGTIKSAGQITRVVYAALVSGAQYLLVSFEDSDAAHVAMKRISKTLSRQTSLTIAGFHTLAEAWAGLSDFTQGTHTLSKTVRQIPAQATDAPLALPDLLPLNPWLERVLGVALAGGFHTLILGPKGCGKSHLLEWVTALAPCPRADFELERVLLAELNSRRMGAPIRRLGVHVKPASLIGQAFQGMIFPGEFSLAHGGLLLADEFPEWARDARESLREPLERGTITVSRARASAELPARFTFFANGNLCPCGGWPTELPIPLKSKVTACFCSPKTKQNYAQRLSGPILDRIDIVLKIYEFKQSQSNTLNRLTELRNRINAFQNSAYTRWGNLPGLIPAHQAEAALAALPIELSSANNLRARHREWRLATGLALWDGLECPGAEHWAEAKQLRQYT